MEESGAPQPEHEQDGDSFDAFLKAATQVRSRRHPTVLAPRETETARARATERQPARLVSWEGQSDPWPAFAAGGARRPGRSGHHWRAALAAAAGRCWNGGSDGRREAHPGRPAQVKKSRDLMLVRAATRDCADTPNAVHAAPRTLGGCRRCGQRHRTT